MQQHITFKKFNLISDKIPQSDFDAVLCRNVMIYFNTDLQEKVLELFNECLMPGGILCLGTRETLEFSKVKDVFDLMDRKNRIFRKKRYDL